MSLFKDHFSTRSTDYAAFRPTYPIALVDMLAELAPDCDRALDSACGAGQQSIMLAERFRNVLAIDASAQQIDHAKSHPRVEYRCSAVEAIHLDDSSIDLVRAAQAAHWFDLTPFYMEMRRILRPSGAIALIAHGIITAEGEVGAVLSRLYVDLIGRFWPPERHHRPHRGWRGRAR